MPLDRFELDWQVGRRDFLGMTGMAAALIGGCARGDASEPDVLPDAGTDLPEETPNYDVCDDPFRAHEVFIESLAAGPNTHVVASLSAGDVKIWDARSARLMTRIAGAELGRGVLTMSSSGRRIAWLASLTFQNQRSALLRQWDVPGERQLEAFVVDDGGTSIAYAPDERVIAGARAGGEIWFRDVETREVLARLGPQTALSGTIGAIEALAFSPDGSMLASGTVTRIIGARRQRGGEVWVFATGRWGIAVRSTADQVRSHWKERTPSMVHWPSGPAGGTRHAQKRKRPSTPQVRGSFKNPARLLKSIPPVREVSSLRFRPKTVSSKVPSSRV